MQTIKIVVVGSQGSGKTEFISNLSEIDVVATERKITGHDGTTRKYATTVAMDFGRITIDENLVMYLFGAPGQKRFGYMWELLAEGMIGFIVMADSTRPETFRETREIIKSFSIIFAPVPYVIVANKQDLEGAWKLEDMRHALRLDPKVKFLSCIATDRNACREVVLELMYLILSEKGSSK